MSKYKVGDTVYVKCKVIHASDDGEYRVKHFSNPVDNESARFIGASEKNMSDMSAEEAWEIAKKLFADLAINDLDEIFGTGWTSQKLMEFSPQEAKAKIEAWKKSKEVFQVGDVVQNIDDPNVKVLITRRYTDRTYNGIDGSGATFSAMDKRKWEKTGLHYDIENILEKFREES